MSEANKHWRLCLSFAVSISAICIPSLPQPIHTAAILNRAVHTRLPTVSHYSECFTAITPSKCRGGGKKNIRISVVGCFNAVLKRMVIYHFMRLLVADPQRHDSQMSRSWPACPLLCDQNTNPDLWKKKVPLLQHIPSQSFLSTHLGLHQPGRWL